MRLLLLRGAPLLVRPLAILLEASIVSKQNVMVLVLPTAMMALTVSSIPVHLAYFQSRGRAGEQIAKEYASALGLIIVVAVAILACVLAAFDAYLSSALIAATCMVYLIEKLSDESSRMLEFRRAFGHWFFVQLLRSVWLVLPILFFKLGADYETAFLATSAGFALVAFVVFWRVTCLMPRPKFVGIGVIRSNLIFLFASILPASYRQVPRMMITRLFPDQAHIYLASAQLAQAAALAFNVRFQIPYRRAIARKTALFQRRRHPLMMRFLIIPVVVAPLWLISSVLYYSESMPDTLFAFILMPLLVADSLTFAILAVHMDYMQWLRRKVSLLETYLANGALLLMLLAAFQIPVIKENQSAISTAATFTLMGVIWIAVIIWRNFKLPNQSHLG